MSLELVVDDGAALLVPQNRHGRAAGETRVGADIDLMQVGRAVDRVPVRAGIIAETPALIRHRRLDDRHRDRAVEPLELAGDQRAGRPRADQRGVQVIAPRLGAKAAFAGRARGAVGRDPMAKAGDLANEAAFGVRRLDRLPGVRPLSVDKHGANSLAGRARSARGGPRARNGGAGSTRDRSAGQAGRSRSRRLGAQAAAGSGAAEAATWLRPARLAS